MAKPPKKNKRRKSSERPDPQATREQAQALRQTILNHLADPHYRPLDPDAFVDEMADNDAIRPALQMAVDGLLADGTLVNMKKGLALAKSADLLTGDIRMLRGGNAIVTALDGSTTVFIPRGETLTAMPGDRVMVRLDPKRELPPGERSRGPSGVVIRVVDRQKLTVVGTLKRQRLMYYVKPMHASITHDIIVPDPADAQIGDRVLVRLEHWTEPEVSPEGEIIEVLGPADDPALDTLSVIKDKDLPMEFPEEVLRQAEQSSVDPAAFEGRVDMRKKFVFTIDPSTARDFDDALSLEKVRGGHWKLGIHIADVSHFVPVGTPLDKEAYKRGTSVYFPDTVIPMLPEQLANGLCSLQPHTDRLAFSVFATLDDDGNILKVSFAETVIHSKLRLSYEQAMEALNTPDGSAYPEADMNVKTVDLIKTVRRLAMRIRKRRFKNGALNMILPEVRFVIGDDGRIEDVVAVASDESHQLIEECMLLANEEVCRYLCSLKVPHIHRIHEEPDPEDLGEIETMFALAGVQVGDLTDRFELARVLNAIQDMPQAAAWYGTVLRSFKRAQYAVPCVGHYGLAKEHYLHFTSPIRRYPDLVVHRILKKVLTKSKQIYSHDKLMEMAAHSSKREDVATESERDLVNMKRTRFFVEQLESGDLRTYDAIVTEVRNFGLFIFLAGVQTQGMVHVSQLQNDFFDFNQQRNELVGRATGRRFCIGDAIKVQICRVDQDRGLIDFTIVEDGDAKPAQGGRSSGNSGNRRSSGNRDSGTSKGGGPSGRKDGGKPRSHGSPDPYAKGKGKGKGKGRNRSRGKGKGGKSSSK